jgi:LuxR family maltose regulon positive regulatory protein
MLRAAEHLQSQLAGPHALASQMTGWLVATQARLRQPDHARATLAALPPEQATTGELRNAAAVIYLAEGDPAEALAAAQEVLDGTAAVIGPATVVEPSCWPRSPTAPSATNAPPTRPPNTPSPWPSRTASSCRSP